MARSHRVVLAGVSLALALTASACQQGPDAATKAKIDQLTKASTERDQLLADVVLQNDRMMSQISAALAHVRIPKGRVKASGESPVGAASRDSVVQEIGYVTARVNEAERKLKESEEHIASLTTLSDSLRQTLEATVASYDSVISDEKATLAAMTVRIDSLTTANGALTDTTNMLKKQNNTVYYIVGTRDEPDSPWDSPRGGRQPVPAHFSPRWGARSSPARALDPKDFTAINKREVMEIPLSSDRTYKIASLQDIEGLASPVPDNRVIGTLRIGNPDKFWAKLEVLDPRSGLTEPGPPSSAGRSGPWFSAPPTAPVRADRSASRRPSRAARASRCR